MTRPRPAPVVRATYLAPSPSSPAPPQIKKKKKKLIHLNKNKTHTSKIQLTWILFNKHKQRFFVLNWFYLKCYDHIIIKTNIFVILLKVGAGRVGAGRVGLIGAGRVNANTHYRPAPVIEAKVLPRSHPATSTGWVKFMRVGTGRCKIAIPIHYKEV